MKISNLKLTSKDDMKSATKVKRFLSDSTKQEPSALALPPGYFEATQNVDQTPPDDNIIATGPHPRLTRPTNYLTLIREESPIRGSFRVDPTLAIPPGAIISKDQHGKELNLKFNSTCGMVETCVEIVRGIVAPTLHMGPARLEMVSVHCDVIATIHDRGQNRFRLTAISHNGNIVINIPSTFTGSIVGRLNRGTIKFATEVQAQLTVLSEQNKESRYFIGDYLRTGYRDDESWTMDHLYVESHGANATVVVNFVPPESSSNSPVIQSRGAQRSRSRISAQKPRQKKNFIRRLFS